MFTSPVLQPDSYIYSIYNCVLSVNCLKHVYTGFILSHQCDASDPFIQEGHIVALPNITCGIQLCPVKSAFVNADLSSRKRIQILIRQCTNGHSMVNGQAASAGIKCSAPANRNNDQNDSPIVKRWKVHIILHNFQCKKHWSHALKINTHCTFKCHIFDSLSVIYGIL